MLSSAERVRRHVRDWPTWLRAQVLKRTPPGEDQESPIEESTRPTEEPLMEDAGGFRRIVVPVDGSEPSDKAVHLASDIASQYGATLVLAHVLLRGASPESLRDTANNEGFLEDVEGDLARIMASAPPPMSGMGGRAEQIPDELLEECGRHVLDRASMAAGAQSATTIETRLLDGEAAPAILQCAEGEHADLIVTGSRGFGDLKSLAVGSVSHKLITDSPCPCLVVK